MRVESVSRGVEERMEPFDVVRWMEASLADGRASVQDVLEVTQLKEVVGKRRGGRWTVSVM